MRCLPRGSRGPSRARPALLRRDVRGRTHVCSLDPVPLMSADQWIGMYRRFWTDRLDTLERILRAQDAASPPPPKNPLPG